MLSYLSWSASLNVPTLTFIRYLTCQYLTQLVVELYSLVDAVEENIWTAVKNKERQDLRF